MTHKLIKIDNYLLVVDESVSPVTDGNYYYADDNIYHSINCRYVFAKKILAHLPLNGSPILEGVPLLPPYSRHQEDGLDKKSVDFIREIGGTEQQRLAFKDGYLEAREKYKYTEDDVRRAISGALSVGYSPKFDIYDLGYEVDNIIKSLHQYPTEFDCEMIPCDLIQYQLYDNIEPEFKPKTITTAQGVQWVGKYK